MIKDEYIRKVHSVKRVIDGDTIEAWIDMGDNTIKLMTLRFLGVNTPERGQHGYYEATEFVQQSLESALIIHVKTYQFKKGGFGRYLAEVFITDENCQYSLNDELIANNLAIPYRR